MPRFCVFILSMALFFTVVAFTGCGGSGTPALDGNTPPGNTPPVAFFTISPATGTTATTFTVDASYSTDGQDPTSALQVRWDWTSDNTYDTPFTPTKTAPHQFSTPGTYTITMQVKDTVGATTTCFRQVVVTANATPVPTAQVTVTPATGTASTVFQFDASGSTDPHDAMTALQVEWDWTSDGVYDTAYSVTKTATFQFPGTGAYLVTVRVKNSSGNTGTATVQVQVNAANTPPLALFSIYPSTGTTATAFTFDASACSDAQDVPSILQVRWDWTSDGAYDTPWSTAKTTMHQFAAPGAYQVTLQVQDSGGLTSTHTALVTVSSSTTGNSVLLRTLNHGTPTDVPWVAFQNGDGGWQVAQRSDTGAYVGTVTDPNGRYGFAYEHVVNNGYYTANTIAVYVSTVAENATMTVELGGAPATTAPVSGALTGVATTQACDVDMGGAYATLSGNSPYYTLEVAPGTYSLLSVLSTSNFAEKMIIRRNVTVAGALTQNLDFTSTEAFRLTGPYSLTFTGGTPTTAFCSYLAPGILNATLAGSDSGTTVASLSYGGVPSAQVAPGEGYVVLLKSATATKWAMFATAANKTVSFAIPDFNASLDTTTAAAYLQPTVSWTSYTSMSYAMLFFQGGLANWTVGISPGWANGRNSYKLPDFSTLNGWNLFWGPQNLTYAEAVAYTWNGVTTHPDTTVFTDGLEMSLAHKVFVDNRARRTQTFRNWALRYARPIGQQRGTR